MSQSTLDNDDLFGEAASEMRADVESSLDAAREELPPVDDVWNVDADNTLGALNGLRSALDIGDAADHLHDAKKWYTMGERAGAFEDADDLGDDIERLDSVVEEIEAAKQQVSDLTSTVPGLKGSLEDVHDAVERDEEARESPDGEDAEEVEAE